MRSLIIVAQVLGILILISAVAIVTLRIDKRDADGPSILFPGGLFTSGEIHEGAEPDWSFTDERFTIELQLDDPPSSRRTFIMESGGRIYVPSGYMRSLLGRIWKDWAFQADAGDGRGAIRIDGVIYPRRLVRITGGPELDGVLAKMAEKYGQGASEDAIRLGRQAVQDGDVWIFELAPLNEEAVEERS